MNQASEGEQRGVEHTDAGRLAVEVPTAVDHDQCTHAGDDQRHHPAQGVHPHRQLEAELRDPRVRLARSGTSR